MLLSCQSTLLHGSTSTARSRLGVGIWMNVPCPTQTACQKGFHTCVRAHIRIRSLLRAMCKVLMDWPDGRMQELETITQKSPEKHLEAAATRTIEAISHGGLAVCLRARPLFLIISGCSCSWHLCNASHAAYAVRNTTPQCRRAKV